MTHSEKFDYSRRDGGKAKGQGEGTHGMIHPKSNPKKFNTVGHRQRFESQTNMATVSTRTRKIILTWGVPLRAWEVLLLCLWLL